MFYNFEHSVPTEMPTENPTDYPTERPTPRMICIYGWLMIYIAFIL